MSTTDLTFAVVATYDDVDRARADFDAIEDLAAAHELHLDDAALLRHAAGRVDVERHDARSTSRGAEGGVIVGALVGLLFPPALAGMLVGAAAGGGIGATIGHLWHDIRVRTSPISAASSRRATPRSSRSAASRSPERSSRRWAAPRGSCATASTSIATSCAPPLGATTCPARVGPVL